MKEYVNTSTTAFKKRLQDDITLLSPGCNVLLNEKKQTNITMQQNITPELEMDTYLINIDWNAGRK